MQINIWQYLEELFSKGFFLEIDVFKMSYDSLETPSWLLRPTSLEP